MVTLHTVNTMTGLGKHEFVDTIVTRATFEAVGMVRVVTGHDSFVKYGLVTDAAAVRTVGADGLTIREEEEIGVSGDPVATLGAFEAVDVEEGLSERDNHATVLVHDRQVTPRAYLVFAW